MGLLNMVFSPISTTAKMGMAITNATAARVESLAAPPSRSDSKTPCDLAGDWVPCRHDEWKNWNIGNHAARARAANTRVRYDAKGNGAGQVGEYRLQYNVTTLGVGRYKATAKILDWAGMGWRATDGSLSLLIDGTLAVRYPSNGIVEYWRRDRDDGCPSQRHLGARGGHASRRSYVSRLYHQTDEETAELILATQTMLPGTQGLAGGGIYFATDPGLTGHKARKKGVILECTVDIGAFKALGKEGDRHVTLERLRAEGYDSVRIQRDLGSGQEYVVYESWRVSDIGVYSY